MTIFSGRKAAVYVTSSTTPVDFAASEATAEVSGSARKRYQITTVAKRYWDEDTGVVVKVGGSTIIPATDYTVEWAGGIINFTVARGAGDVISVHSGKYYTVAVFAGAKEFSIDFETDTTETPSFGMQGWNQKKYLMTGAKVTLSKWWTDNLAMSHIEGAKMVVVLFEQITNSTNMTGPRYEGFGFMSKDSIKVAASNATEENLELDIDGPMNYRAA